MLHHNQTIIHKTLSDMMHFNFSSEEVPVLQAEKKNRICEHDCDSIHPE